MGISDWSSDVCSSDRVEVAGHGRATGMSAELMVPKWFDKNPELGVADPVAALRRSLELACDLYLGRGDRDTAFGHHASRSEARRVGKECASTCSTWRSPSDEK